MKREEIEDHVNALEDEFCKKYEDKYDEDQIITFQNDLIKYAVERIVKTFEIDEVSAEKIVRDIVEEDFPKKTTSVDTHEDESNHDDTENADKYEELAEQYGVDEEAPQKRSKKKLEDY